MINPLKKQLPRLKRYAAFSLMAGVLLFLPSTLYGKLPDQRRFWIETSYESYSLPKNEEMGMLKLGLHHSINRYLEVGVDGFAALSGQRGGFITTGISSDFNYPLMSPLFFKAGVFIGGGGGRGGYTLVGGGLMLRYHGGIEYQVPHVGSLLLGYSYVDFPNNGAIHTGQPYLSFTIPYTLSLSQGHAPSTRSPQKSPRKDKKHNPQLAILFRNIYTPENTPTDTGGSQASFQTLGIVWQSPLDQHWFLQCESEGALGGGSAGYMQILAGLGYQLPLTETLTAHTTWSIGGGGGGNVATGGGLLSDIGMGLQYRLSPYWVADISLSKLSAHSGAFSSPTLGLRFGRHFGAATPHLQQDTEDLEPHPIRFRIAAQRYLKGSNNWRSHHDNENVDNMGIQLYYALSPTLFITGQAIAAYNGNAGAYMAGLVGLGIKQPLFDMFSMELDGLIGPAGGGGLTVGAGLVYQTNISLIYPFSEFWSIGGSIGHLQAANGPFQALVLGLGVTYDFTLYTAPL